MAEIDSKKKTKDISKMKLSELRKLHADEYKKYLKHRMRCNEIAKLIQEKGGK